MSPVGVLGAFTETMLCMADGLHEKLDLMEDISTLFFSSDMMPWHTNHIATIQNKSGQKNVDSPATVKPNATAILSTLADGEAYCQGNSVRSSIDVASVSSPLNFVETVDKNVSQVLKRIREVAPRDKPPMHDRTSCLTSHDSVPKLPSGLNQGVHHLIKVASSPENLSKQSAMWAPYF